MAIYTIQINGGGAVVGLFSGPQPGLLNTQDNVPDTDPRVVAYINNTTAATVRQPGISFTGQPTANFRVANGIVVQN